MLLSVTDRVICTPQTDRAGGVGQAEGARTGVNVRSELSGLRLVRHGPTRRNRSFTRRAS
jgi:hypothetical protein